jgi:hypothetical protein
VLNALYRGWSALVFLLVIVQVGFAGYGAFSVAHNTDDGGTVDEDSLENSFGLHIAFGYIVVLAGLIFLLIGVAAGFGRWRLGRHGLLALLLVIQVILAWIGEGVPQIGFLHPINALLIFTMAGWIAWSEWRTSRGVGEPVAPAA